MEEKELSVSGSPVVYSVSEQPQVSGVGVGGGMVPHVINIAASTSISVPTAVDGGGVGGCASNDIAWKKKRGRPRKYDADGNLRVSTKSPSGYGSWKLLASLGELFGNTARGDFTPHVVTVHAGEDVAAKILSFSLKGPRGICVLSANGTVSNVTIRQPGSSGGLLTYEGRFEILSLTGSFTAFGNGGVRSRTGGLSVSLAGPDGRILGGGIAGVLTAASPIQIVVGSFMPNGFKVRKKKHRYEPRSDPDTLTEATPTPSISLTPASQLQSQNHEEEDKNIHNEQNPNVASPYTAAWNGSEPVSAQRSYPDINVSVSVE